MINPKTSHVPAVVVKPDGTLYALAVEFFGCLPPSIFSSAPVATRGEGEQVALGLVAAARKVRGEAFEKDLGELLETLPNGFQIRRKRAGTSPDAMVTLHVIDYAEALDPDAKGGPYRGSAHNAWHNRATYEPRWRLSFYMPPRGDRPEKNVTRTDIKTEAGAIKALRRLALEAYPVEGTPDNGR